MASVPSRRLLRVPWTERRSNQPILKEISPAYSLEGWCWNWSPILWPPDAKRWLIRKEPDAGKHWRQEEKGATENEMVGWHHQLNGHEFKQALGDGEGQGSLPCCSPWGHKESDMTERLNNNNWSFTKRKLNNYFNTDNCIGPPGFRYVGNRFRLINYMKVRIWLKALINGII